MSRANLTRKGIVINSKTNNACKLRGDRLRSVYCTVILATDRTVSPLLGVGVTTLFNENNLLQLLVSLLRYVLLRHCDKNSMAERYY